MEYSFYSPSENKVFVARNAEFFESKLLDLKASGSVEDLELIHEEDTNPYVDTGLNHEEDDQEIDKPQSDINPIRKSSRTRRAPDRMCLYIDAEEHELGDLGEPANYKAALLDPESKKWLGAMNVEMQSMKDSDVWVLVELLPNTRTVGSKWLFKKKTNMDGAIYIFKARLVVKGFTQTYGVDYEETFSPVVDIKAIRIFIAIAAYYDYEIWQMDVKTAFLNGHLSEEVYMEQPEGFVNPKYPNHKFGFTQNPDKPCVYLKASGSYIAILILYVDDILLMGNNIPMLQDVKSYLGRSFAMKDLGEAAYILGIMIYRDRTIPMQEKLKLSKSQGASTPAEKQRMPNIPNASAVGSIIHGKGKGKTGHASTMPHLLLNLKLLHRLRKIILQRTPFATNVGLRGSKKLKPGALSLYVGDGHHAAVEAIGTYHLELPSGLVIVLNNCHYAPSITSGVISVSRLFDDGFINHFDDNNVISVSKNNLVYFMAVPRDGIFE
nr:hypothetical protein [Tanacetum cinerariifolium]